MKSFVVSVFAYSLFSKPSGHPVNSRRHYFFSKVAVLLVPIPISFMFLNLRLIITIVLSSWLYLNFKG